MMTYEKFATRGTDICTDRISWYTYSVALYLISIPLDFINLSGMGSVTRFISIVTIVINLLKPIRLPFNKLTVSLLFFLLFNLASIGISPYRQEAFENFLSILVNIILIFWVALRKYNMKEILFLFRTVFFSGWIIVIFILAFSVTGVSGRISFNVDGFSQNLNYISGYLFFSQAYSLNKILFEKKYIYLVSYIAFIAVVFVTGSRGGLVASTVLLFTMFLIINSKSSMKQSKKVKMFFGELFLLITAVVCFYFVIPDDIISRYTIFSVVESKGSNRFLIWNSMLESFKNFSLENKLFGVGSGVSYHYSYNQYYVAHNVYIAYLLDIGILGLLSYIVMLIRAFIVTIKKSNAILTASLMGFCAMNVTSTFTNFKPLWALFMLIIIYDINTKYVPAIHNQE